MTRSQIPWLRVIAEGVVVVVSILLAFGIDAWWEDRQDRAFEREALRRLQVEFSENLDRIDTSSFNKVSANASSLYELVESLPPEAESVSISNTLLAAVLATGTFDRVTPVLDSLIRSGRFEIIRDPRILEAVATYERWLAQLAQLEAASGVFSDTRMRLALMARGDMSRVFSRRGPEAVLEESDEVTVLNVDNELKALIAEKHARNENVRRVRAEVRTSLEDLLGAISRSTEN